MHAIAKPETARSYFAHAAARQAQLRWSNESDFRTTAHHPEDFAMLSPRKAIVSRRLPPP